LSRRSDGENSDRLLCQLTVAFRYAISESGARLTRPFLDFFVQAIQIFASLINSVTRVQAGINHFICHEAQVSGGGTCDPTENDNRSISLQPCPISQDHRRFVPTASILSTVEIGLGNQGRKTENCAGRNASAETSFNNSCQSMRHWRNRTSFLTRSKSSTVDKRNEGPTRPCIAHLFSL
jgi:hypothetical protein